ncbi:MAG TPA: ABC transporter substrate-binding protein, partial [Clostridiales bacterium]|nr:ABC transporter substrate-binding protein [Clostridiales bacterium]
KIEYYLGPSLMEPDHRVETNRKGFCSRHFELLYNRKSNALGLALILSTHLAVQAEALKKAFPRAAASPAGGKLTKLLQGGRNRNGNEAGVLTQSLTQLESRCCVCESLAYTMSRYTEVIFHLWHTEPDFQKLYLSKKGFCLPHLNVILSGAAKHLSGKEADDFMQSTMEMQFANLDRIQQEIDWFTQKFDYRNKDAPWGNSKDAVSRTIRKIAGPCRLDDK